MTVITDGLIVFVSPEGRDEAEPLRSQLPSPVHDLLLQPAGSLSFSETLDRINERGLDQLSDLAPTLVAAESLGLDASSFGSTWAAVGVPVFTDEELEAFTHGWEAVEPEELPNRLEGRGWWEALRAIDGRWALLPQDRSETPTVSLTLLLRIQDRIVFERLNVLELFRSRTAPKVETDQQCALEGTKQEPNQPYVGSCGRRGCTGGCVPITGTASGGTKVLLGCKC